MTTVGVYKDEWYVWAPLPIKDDPTHAEVTVEVDEATARRWRKAVKDFEAMTAEIDALMDKT